MGVGIHPLATTKLPDAGSHPNCRLRTRIIHVPPPLVESPARREESVDRGGVADDPVHAPALIRSCVAHSFCPTPGNEVAPRLDLSPRFPAVVTRVEGSNRSRAF